MAIFEEQDCIACFVRFGVPHGFTAQRRADKKSFYCPNGHSMSYTESEADRLRRERDSLKQNQAWYEQRLKNERDAREAAERRASAARGQVTKLRRRAAGGACPCCNRTFPNLAAHMKTKHPGFAEAEAVPEGATVQ